MITPDIVKELENSISLLGATLESTADGILVVSSEGKIVRFNRKFIDMWNIPDSILESLEDSQALEFVLDQLKNPEAFLEKVKELYGQPEAESYDVLEFKDGRIFERYSQSQRIGEKIVGRVWSFRDVTERKRIEERLRASEERTRLVIDTAYDAFVAINTDGLITDWNRQAETTFGWFREEAIGRPLTETIIPPQYREAYKRGLEYFLSTGEGPMLNKRIEITALHRDGHEFHVELTISPLRLGETYVFNAFVHDITERRRTEEALRDSEERYRTLIENAYDLISEASSDARWLYFSPNYKDVLGYDPHEGIGRRIFENNETVHPDDLAVFNAEFTRTVNTFSSSRGIFRLLHKNGEWRWFEGVCTPFRRTTGEIRVVCISRDITERKRAEETLKESFAQLSKKNRYETIISTVTRDVHSSINLQEVFENAVEAMSKNIERADNVSIYMVEGKEIILKAYRGYPNWYIERVRTIPYGRGFTWKAIIDGKLRYCADVDEDTVIGPAGKEIGTKSYVSMPICFEGKPIGAISINSLQKNAFDEEELKLLEIVAQQIEVAINNAKQAEVLRKALSEVEQLKNRLQAENVYLREEIRTEHNFEEIIGQSQVLKNVLRKVEQVAPTDATVLVQGETGTGKELIARAIHNLSPRKDRPLVKVNCGAIAAGLVESELFGHEKGAFTGAIQRRVGRFELANGSTIFLDEVGELHQDTQVELLRVLQEGEFERVGGSQTIKVNVRVIAATNRDLKKAVEEGNFRPDLYYRLSVFPILISPIRERKEDIELLVNYFTAKYSTKLGKKVEVIPKKTMDSLLSYHWPGNVRELENIIERAVILMQGSTLKVDDLLDIRPYEAALQGSSLEKLEDMERSHILHALEKTDWVIDGRRGAALVLGLNPGTLRSRMRKLGIKKPQRTSN
ncbi:MAG: sigma 54-interacting transcriptional regulator [Ignavibacteriales bacterium]